MSLKLVQQKKETESVTAEGHRDGTSRTYHHSQTSEQKMGVKIVKETVATKLSTADNNNRKG